MLFRSVSARDNHGDIVMYGSASVVQQIGNLGLVDEYHLLIHPLLLGSGKRLLEKVGSRVSLNLSSVRQFKSGVVLMVYQKG